MSAGYSGFRRLVRAARVAFGHDLIALDQAKSTLKQAFLVNRSVTDQKVANSNFSYKSINNTIYLRIIIYIVSLKLDFNRIISWYR